MNPFASLNEAKGILRSVKAGYKSAQRGTVACTGQMRGEPCRAARVEHHFGRGIHDVKQRSDHSTIGAACLRGTPGEFGIMQRKSAQASESGAGSSRE